MLLKEILEMDRSNKAVFNLMDVETNKRRRVLGYGHVIDEVMIKEGNTIIDMMNCNDPSQHCIRLVFDASG